ncbi:kinase-like domain-containing protein [Cladochytrium replicatum]|nr:kinase-like domain-containing protein [Cladochytrium replicatum]
MAMDHKMLILDTPQRALSLFRTLDLPSFPHPPKSCTALSGGLANFVYRVSFDHGPSVILKHYAPFLAKQSSFPLPRTRFDIEAGALSWAGQTFVNHGRIRVPKLYHSHGEPHYVIIMEDAGNELVSLLDYFRANRDSAEVESLAETLVSFLSTVHSYTPQNMADPDRFRNENGHSIIKGYYYGTFADALGRYPGDVQEALSGARALVAKYKSEEEPRTCLLMGDFWPNSVYLGKDAQIWILDWEMMRYGRGFFEVVQMCANLYLMEKSSVFDGSAVTRFRKTLVSHYMANMNVRVVEADGAQFMAFLLAIIGNSVWNIHGDEAAKIIVDAARNMNFLFV